MPEQKEMTEMLTPEQNSFVENAERLIRSELIKHLIDEKRDVNAEAGYPDILYPQDYWNMYEREGVSQRVVNVYPKECWRLKPHVKENEDETDTEFEKAFDALLKATNLWHYLLRADICSGIGRYGVLLVGTDDGLPLEQPVDGWNEDRPLEPIKSERNIIYLRAFDERLAPVSKWNEDQTNPRYGYPDMYNLEFVDYKSSSGEDGTTAQRNSTTVPVHWTRVVHFADNILTNDVLGTPRMEASFNYLWNIRKILAGSGEGYWQTATPIFDFSTNPEYGMQLDEESLKQNIQQVIHGFQRYITGEGGKWNTLSPNIGDPENHFMIQVKAISATTGIPIRKLIGTEQAHLASTQDSESWNEKLAARQEDYLTPAVVVRTIRHLQLIGVLPPTEEDPIVDWPDLNETKEEDRATTAGKWTEALSKYVAGNVVQLVPEREYMIHVLGWEENKVDAILAQATGILDEEDALVEEDEFNNEE